MTNKNSIDNQDINEKVDNLDGEKKDKAIEEFVEEVEQSVDKTGNETDSSNEREVGSSEKESDENDFDNNSGDKSSEMVVDESSKDAPIEDNSGEETEEQVTAEKPDEESLEKDSEKTTSHPKKMYHEHNFLMFGQDNYLDCLDIEGTADYLKGMGIDNNSLEQARTSERVANINLGMYPNANSKMFCNFCGMPIYGTEYEILSDGRKRCMRCSRTAIKTKEEFQELFEIVKRNMEVLYSIRFDTSIQVEMANSRKIHRLARVPYDPDNSRVLGFAQDCGKNNYKLFMENGSPRMSSILTMAHEMTHIWQYTHWNRKQILRKYGKKNELIIYEGMAKWAEIQYAYLINEPRRAEMEIINTLAREDVYGYGFRLYYSIYGLTKKTYITGETPFMDPESPLGDIVI